LGLQNGIANLLTHGLLVHEPFMSL